jgi:hypothetical protein
LIVSGVSKPTQSSSEPAAMRHLLQRWYPSSRIHLFDPFSGSVTGSTKGDVLDRQAKSLLKFAANLPSSDTQEKSDVSHSTDNSSSFVFLSHDLGGVVLKKALVLATEDVSYRKICQKTMAIYFFGVLHRLLPPDTWEEQLSKLFAVSQQQNQLLHASIQELSGDFDTLEDTFQGISSCYKIFNIYEESENPVSSFLTMLLFEPHYLEQRRCFRIV